MTALVRNVEPSTTVLPYQKKVPTRTDGAYYRFEMIFDNGGYRAYDDRPAGLLQYLIPAYNKLNRKQRLQARIKHAVNAQVRLQAKLNNFFEDSPRTPSEEKILNDTRVYQPRLSQWDCPVPLVLVDSFYQPYGDYQPPVSGIADVAIPPNLWWLRPAKSEFEYLRSLHETSIIDLHMAKDQIS